MITYIFHYRNYYFTLGINGTLIISTKTPDNYLETEVVPFTLQANQNNIEVVMLTGDNKIVAETIGQELEIDKVVSEVLPNN